MNTKPDDINIEEERRYFDKLRNMTGEQRALISFELSDKARQELISDIKKQHPEFTKRQVMNEVIRRCYGEELYQKIVADKGWKD
jgi:hypothetical protein